MSLVFAVVAPHTMPAVPCSRADEGPLWRVLTRRATQGCNAWFWCKEEQGCREPQMGAAVELHDCLLQEVAMLPLPPPEAEAHLQFSSFAAGFLVNEGEPGGGGGDGVRL